MSVLTQGEPMQHAGELAILFADVSGSTQLYEALGDVRAREIVAGCVATMAEATQRHGGTLVKTIGDEVMTTFPTADAAVAAAAAMQEAITGQLVVEGRQLAIRVGFHFGPILVEDSDIYGDAVNVASRMANQAKAGQILTTGATVARMSGLWQASARQIDRTDVKGKRDPIDVFEVVWQAQDVTLIRQRPWANTPRGGGGQLILSAAGRRLALDDSRPTLTVGRADQNDLVMKNDVISRLHARVEYRNGRFVLTDQSANGTFVVPDGGQSAYVHRDSFVLVSAGMLGLGQMPTPGSPITVRYEPAR
jgi:adenylate cyclase